MSQRAQQFVIDPAVNPYNVIEPGKRPRVTLTPSLALRDGKPWLAFAVQGGDTQDQNLLQFFLNIVEFGMTPQEAVEAPRFQSEHFYTTLGYHEFVAGKLNVESRVQRNTVEKLNALGHRVTMTGPWSNSSAPTVIKIAEGVLDGGADPRRGRFIFGR